MAIKMRLRLDQLAKFRRIAGLETDAAFARRIDMSPAQVSRVLHNKSGMGLDFVVGCLAAFGLECAADLFVIDDGPEGNGAAA